MKNNKCACCLPSIFLRHEVSKPELRGYRVSSRSVVERTQQNYIVTPSCRGRVGAKYHLKKKRRTNFGLGSLGCFHHSQFGNKTQKLKSQIEKHNPKCVLQTQETN